MTPLPGAGLHVNTTEPARSIANDCGDRHEPGRIQNETYESGVLEQAGLVTTAKVGRVRTCKLGLRGLEQEAAWIKRYRKLWDARFDELEELVEELERKETVYGRKKR